MMNFSLEIFKSILQQQNIKLSMQYMWEENVLLILLDNWE